MDRDEIRAAWDAATEAEVQKATADPEFVLLVSEMCDHFGEFLATILASRFPTLDPEHIKATASIDAWLLASDLTDFVAAEAAQHGE